MSRVCLWYRSSLLELPSSLNKVAQRTWYPTRESKQKKDKGSSHPVTWSVVPQAPQELLCGLCREEGPFDLYTSAIDRLDGQANHTRCRLRAKQLFETMPLAHTIKVHTPDSNEIPCPHSAMNNTQHPSYRMGKSFGHHRWHGSVAYNASYKKMDSTLYPLNFPVNEYMRHTWQGWGQKIQPSTSLDHSRLHYHSHPLLVRSSSPSFFSFAVC